MTRKAGRLMLQEELERYFDEDPRVTNAEDHVSYQPNEDSKIPYPHIVYTRDPAYVIHADNRPYVYRDKYRVTYIDRNPDSLVFDKLSDRSGCSNVTNFVSDGLNHFVFDLYH